MSRLLGICESSIRSNLTAKKIRDKLNISKDIATRTIQDIICLENDDKLKIIKKIKTDGIKSSKIREYSKILQNSSDDVKKSFFKNQIDIKQAKQISKIKNPKIKREIIKAHKEIKKIDKDIDKQILKQVKSKNNQENLVQINEFISSFRQNTIELQNQNQTTIKSFLKCIPLIDLMDNEQSNKLKYNLELLENNINNMLMVLEKANNRINI